MDSLVSLIMGSSTEFDAFVMVRLVIILLIIEFIGIIFNTIGRIGK